MIYRLTASPKFFCHCGPCNFSIENPTRSWSRQPAGNKVTEACNLYPPVFGSFMRILKSSIASRAAISRGLGHVGPMEKTSPVRFILIEGGVVMMEKYSGKRDARKLVTSERTS